MSQRQRYLKTNRLVAEVPGVPENEKWFLWHGREGKGAVWHGATRAEGEAWAEANGIEIDEVEIFEP